jgi:tetratricopeptide (TPR) repeat protein
LIHAAIPSQKHKTPVSAQSVRQSNNLKQTTNTQEEDTVHLPAIRRYLYVLALCGCPALALYGQGLSGLADVRGEVTWESFMEAGSLSVELISSGRIVGRASVMSDGTFELRDVPAGEYEARLAGPRETVIERQFISVRGHSAGLTFRLAPKEIARPASGTVTVYSLSHPPPSAARREFLRAEKAAQEGAAEEAIRHLRKALAIYPEFAEAHNDLGVQYMRQRSYAVAEGEFEEAVKLDPQAVRPNTNLAMALYALGHYADAERVARRAVAADPSFPQAQRALNLVLSSSTGSH